MRNASAFGLATLFAVMALAGVTACKRDPEVGRIDPPTVVTDLKSSSVSVPPRSTSPASP